MDNQQEHKKNNLEKPEKKLSRTNLTFYIVGLFLFAIALILVSYVSQVQSDKELEDLSSQLNEQQTASQGFSQKVEELQRQLDENSRLIELVKSAYGVKTNDELLQAVEAANKQTELKSKILQAQNAVLQQNMEEASHILTEIKEIYSEEERSVDSGILGSEDAEVLQELESMINNLPPESVE